MSQQEIEKSLVKNLEAAESSHDRSRLLVELGALAEEDGKPVVALDAYRKALVEHADAGPLIAAAKVMEREGCWLPAVRMRRAALSLAPDHDIRAAWLARLVEIQLFELKQPEEAVASLVADPEITLGNATCFMLLEEALKAAGRTDEIVTWYRRAIAEGTFGDGQADVWTRAAVWFEKADVSEDERIEVYRKLVDLRETDSAAGFELKRLLVRKGRWEELFTLKGVGDGELFRIEAEFVAEGNVEAAADAYLRFAEHVPDKAREYLWRAYDLFMRCPEKEQDALNLLGKILKIDARDARALELLGRAYRRERRWEELAEVLRRRCELEKDREKLVELLCEWGRINETKTGRFERALSAYRHALGKDPGNSTVLAALIRLYGRNESWRNLADVLEGAAESASDSTARGRLWFETGEVYSRHLAKPLKARQCYEKSLSYDSRLHAARERLEALEEGKSGRQEELPLEAPASPQKAEVDVEGEKTRQDVSSDETATEEKEGRIEATTTKTFPIAPVIEETPATEKEGKDEPEQDASASEDEGEKEPASDGKSRIEDTMEFPESAFENLDELSRKALEAEANEAWTEAVRCYEKMVKLTVSTDDRMGLYKRIGKLRYDRLDDPKGAAEAWEEVARHRPESLEVLNVLAQLYAQTERHTQAAKYYQKLIDLETSPEEETRLRLVLAGLLQDKLGDHLSAVEQYEKILEIDPTTEGVLDSLLAIQREMGRILDLVEFLERLIGELGDEEVDAWVGLTIWLARIHHEEMDDLPSAREIVDRALEEVPGEERLLSYQAGLLANSPEHAADSIDKYRELIRVSPFKLEAWHGLYQVFRENEEWDRAYCCVLGLEFLQDLSPEQLRFAEEIRALRIRRFSSYIPELDQRRLLVHPGENSEIGTATQILAKVLPRMVPPNLGQFSLETCYHAAGSSASFRHFEHAAQYLGIERFELYIAHRQPNLLHVADTRPQTVVLGGDFALAADSIRRFAMGKAVSRLKRNRSRFIDINHVVLKRWIETLIYLFYNDFTPEFTKPATLNRFADSMRAEIPGNLMGDARLAAEAIYHTRDKTLDYESFLKAVRHTENRLGLLLSGSMMDAALVVHYLAQGKPPKRPKSTKEVLVRHGTDDEVKEMLRFLVSNEYFELRSMTKIAAAYEP